MVGVRGGWSEGVVGVRGGGVRSGWSERVVGVRGGWSEGWLE